MDRHEALKEAARLVESVMATLDTGTETCDRCDVRHYANRSEWQLHLEMQAVAVKLNRWATRFYKP